MIHLDLSDRQLYCFIGFVYGMVLASIVWTSFDALSETGQTGNSTEIVLNTENQLPDARNYCQEQGFDWGTYSESQGIEGDTLSITCYPEQDGSWTTYYFDLNMTQIDKEVTTTR